MTNNRFLALSIAAIAVSVGLATEAAAEYRYRKVLNASSRIDLCPSGWVSLGVGTSCYRIETTARDWASARAQCQAQGGDLVTISSAAEQNVVAAVMQPYVNYWIGYDDQAVENSWVWTRSEGGAFTAWGPGEPNNAGGNEDCVQGRAVSIPYWNDMPCTGHLMASVCER